jgi:hypothetical protein
VSKLDGADWVLADSSNPVVDAAVSAQLDAAANEPEPELVAAFVTSVSRRLERALA